MVKVSLKYSAMIAAAAVIFSGVAVAQTQPQTITYTAQGAEATFTPAKNAKGEVATKTQCKANIALGELLPSNEKGLKESEDGLHRDCRTQLASQDEYNSSLAYVCTASTITKATCNGSWDEATKCTVKCTDVSVDCVCVPLATSNSTGGSGGSTGGGSNGGGKDDLVLYEFLNSIVGDDQTGSEPLE